MLFSSIIFLFFFLPVVLGIYYIVPNKYKNSVILIFSLIFYTYGEQYLVLAMLLSTIVDYFSARIIEKGYRNQGLVLSILTNISLLIYFKYSNFVFENYNIFISILGIDTAYIKNIPEVLLPLGISFYTFQTMSYTIDVYNGSTKANRNFIDFAAYVTFFPQLIAGPIVRYIEINNQLIKKTINLQNFSNGIERFIFGLAKKMIIANYFASIADSAFSATNDQLSTTWAWIGAISYSIQIYFDFSGYSDMAIGLGKMFGFDFPENFNYPYISRSIKDFWRRWHITLSRWFRDYLYIPLGGNKKGNSRTYINLFIVFFVTGLWHGASWNFILWGLFHGMFLVIERIGFQQKLDRLPRFINHFYVLIIVLVAWVLFRSDSLTHALLYLKSMFVYSTGEYKWVNYMNYLFINIQTLFFFVLAIIFSIPTYKFFASIFNQQANRKISLISIQLIKNLSLVIFIPLILTFILPNSSNDFHYLENRLKTRKPKMNLNASINTKAIKENIFEVKKYIVNSEAFYEDNFIYSNTLISFNSLLQLNLFNKSPIPEKVVMGKDGWMFLGNSYSNCLSEAFGLDIFNEEELETILNNVKNIDEWATDHKISLYISIAPNKHSVYRHFLFKSENKIITKLDQVTSILKTRKLILLI